MTYNVIGVYDPASQRTISFERREDPVRLGSIYANALLVYDPINQHGHQPQGNQLESYAAAERRLHHGAAAPECDRPDAVDRHPLGGLGRHPIGNAVYLVNGANQTAPGGHPQDTWRFNLATRTWARVALTGPHPPSDVGDFSGMIYDPPSRKLAYFHATYPNGTVHLAARPNNRHMDRKTERPECGRCLHCVGGVCLRYET